MKSNLLLLALSLFLCNVTYSQHEQVTDNWETYQIDDEKLGTIRYHVAKHKINSAKPLLIYLQGSGNLPLFWKSPKGWYSNGITLDFNAMSNDYHIVLISKPNTPLVDTVRITPSGRKEYPWNEEYIEKYSLDWRVESADLVIEDALKKLNTTNSKLIVWGHSEGSQVAPAVAAKNKKVTHVIAMMGNALNHLYDFILMERLAALTGEQSNDEAQSNIDSLFNEFAKIYQDPKATDKEWFGESYYKWSSFTLKAPIENMLSLDIPILYVAGGNDRHSIMNMDYAKLEFLRQGKDNLTYKVFPNCDHFFLETKTDATGKKEWIDHLGEVNAFALDWVGKH